MYNVKPEAVRHPLISQTQVETLVDHFPSFRKEGDSGRIDVTVVRTPTPSTPHCHHLDATR